MLYNNRFFKYLVGIILILLIIFLLGEINYVIVPLKKILAIIFLPVIGAGLFYYLLRPIVNYLEKKGVKRTLSIVIVFAVIIAFFSVMSIYGGAFIKSEFSSFYRTFSQNIKIAQKSTENILQEENWWIFSIDDLKQKSIALLESLFTKFTQNIAGVISTVANIGTLIVLIPFVLFFFLKDGEEFHKNFMKIIPDKHKNKIRHILRDIDKTLSIYITGQLVVASFIGLLTYIGYLIIDLPNALVLAFFSMITSIIPFLGVFIGLLPAMFFALTTDLLMVLKVLIVVTVVQQLEGNFISPNIIGHRLNIHPLTIIFIVIIAISLFGIVGAFIAVPTYAVAKVIIKHFYKI